jgi:drug/metabolite transporter (DMT)-like permease
MKRHLDPTGIALVVLAAAGFGIMGPLARVAGDLGFTAVTFAIWRAIGSVVALSLLLAIGIALQRTRTTPLSAISRLEWIQLVAMGIFVAGTTLGLFLGYERTTIALTLIVFYTYPTIVAVVATGLYGEPLGAWRLAAILLASLGMVLVVLAPSDGSGGGLDILGVLFALTAAGCQVGYALVASRGFASVPAFQASTIMRGIPVLAYAIFVVPIVVVIGDGPHLVDPLGGAEAWVVIVIAGVFGAALPTVGLVAGYRRVGPTRGAVLMLFEPVVGVLLAALWLAEQPQPVQLLGGLLVLVGAGLVQLAPVARRVEPEPTAE